MIKEYKIQIFEKRKHIEKNEILEKANEKNPDGPIVAKDNWQILPTTLRYQISNQIMGIEQERRENFPF